MPELPPSDHPHGGHLPGGVKVAADHLVPRFYLVGRKRHIPVVASVFEEGHGRAITWTLRAKQASEHIREAWSGTSWIVEVIAVGIRDSKTFRQTHFFLTSFRTTPEALLQLVRDLWSIEVWHWIRDTQLHEDVLRYRGNGAGALATFRTAALNLLRLAGFQSIRAEPACRP